jgi:hypothetical protein
VVAPVDFWRVARMTPGPRQIFGSPEDAQAP